METQKQAPYGNRSISFKSYYVVWKQKAPIVINGLFLMFKSYYVVWKLRIGKEVNKLYLRFKSYYVVWKLIGFSYILSPRACLNRTMQYGNANQTAWYRSKISFKSYYVVWKHSLQQTQLPQVYSFKSYYVVWKLPKH